MRTKIGGVAKNLFAVSNGCFSESRNLNSNLPAHSVYPTIIERITEASPNKFQFFPWHIMGNGVHWRHQIRAVAGSNQFMRK